MGVGLRKRRSRCGYMGVGRCLHSGLIKIKLKVLDKPIQLLQEMAPGLGVDESIDLSELQKQTVAFKKTSSRPRKKITHAAKKKLLSIIFVETSHLHGEPSLVGVDKKQAQNKLQRGKCRPTDLFNPCPKKKHRFIVAHR